MAHSKCNARGCTLHHHHHHRQETIETCTRTRAAPKNFSHFNSVAILFSENPFFFSSVFCVVVARDGVFLPLCASAAAATPWRRFMCTTTKHFTGMTPQKSHWDVSFGRKKKGRRHRRRHCMATANPNDLPFHCRSCTIPHSTRLYLYSQFSWAPYRHHLRHHT